MYVPADRLIRSLIDELSAHFGSDRTEASLGQSALSALKLLASREAGGAGRNEARRTSLASLIDVLVKDAPPALAARLGDAKQSLIGQPAGIADMAQAMQAIETTLADDDVMADILDDVRLGMLRAIVDWEVADRTAAIDAANGNGQPHHDREITRERFEAYLQDRFNEATLAVTEFRPLSGGFGKETILLSVTGKAIDGKLVIRRDPELPTVDNDCHRVALEYPVIRAVYARGFPAPDALWLDTEHRLLPGGDFLVMRMAPGRAGGNVFHATEALSTDQIEVLAQGIARLHTLPPLTELGDLTGSIRKDLWQQPMADLTRQYIIDWQQYFLANSHNPSPSLMALYRWMLANVPDAPDGPVLVHGDIGFHNMLIDEGRLTALVDWEFAHIGDPAEDLGSVRNALGDDRWGEVMARYRAAGGHEVTPERLHFFRIWQHVRNASASNLAMGKFQTGEIPDLKLAYTGHYHFPLFIKAAWDLIEAGPDGAVSVDY